MNTETKCGHVLLIQVKKYQLVRPKVFDTNQPEFHHQPKPELPLELRGETLQAQQTLQGLAELRHLVDIQVSFVACI
jgi:hypothetical protein